MCRTCNCEMYSNIILISTLLLDGVCYYLAYCVRNQKTASDKKHVHVRISLHFPPLYPYIGGFSFPRSTSSRSRKCNVQRRISLTRFTVYERPDKPNSNAVCITNVLPTVFLTKTNFSWIINLSITPAWTIKRNKKKYPQSIAQFPYARSVARNSGRNRFSQLAYATVQLWPIF